VRVAVLGTGLIGGSIGLALRRLPDVEAVVAYDRDPSARAAAVRRGAADAEASSAATAVEGADLVFVATPVRAIPQVIEEASPGLRPGQILTDVGSTKSRLVVEVEKSLVEGVIFIGGHPMAGSEREGIEAAEATLFDGRWWILTPTPRVEPDAYRTLHGLLARLGARVIALDPEAHDDLLAVISHLPHLTATALMNLAAERRHAGLLALAAGGFRDVTRVAASNPDMWVDICVDNAEAIARALDELAGRLRELGEVVRGGRLSELRKRLSAAREARRSLGAKPLAGEPVELSLPVPDRPGVLAEVTTAVGDLGINIEDLQITHAEEGGRGTLRLIVLGVDPARRAKEALARKGFEVMLLRV
jgi:prephenate dehydrogenase